MKKISVITSLLLLPVFVKAQTIEDVRELRMGDLEVKMSNQRTSHISMSGSGSKYLGGWCQKAVVIVHERGKNNTSVYVYMVSKRYNTLNREHEFSLCNDCVVKAVTEAGIVAKRPNGNNQHYHFNGVMK